MKFKIIKLDYKALYKELKILIKKQNKNSKKNKTNLNDNIHIK